MRTRRSLRWMYTLSVVPLLIGMGTIGCQQEAKLGPSLGADAGGGSSSPRAPDMEGTRTDTGSNDDPQRCDGGACSETGSPGRDGSDALTMDASPRDTNDSNDLDDTSRDRPDTYVAPDANRPDTGGGDARDGGGTSKSIKRILVTPLDRAGSLSSRRYDVPMGTVFSFKLGVELADGTYQKLPSSAKVKFLNTFGSIEVHERPVHRYFLKHTQDRETIYQVRAKIDYNGRTYYKNISIHFWKPDAVQATAVVYPEYLPEGPNFDKRNDNPRNTLGVGQFGTPFLVITGYRGNQPWSRNAVPPAVLDNVTFKVKRGSAPVARWAPSAGEIRGRSAGEVEATLQAKLPSKTFETSTMLEIVDGSFQKMTALQTDGDEWTSPWSFIQGRPDECQEYHLVEKHADAQGRTYFVSADWRQATVNYRPSGAVRLDKRANEICPVGPEDRIVTEKISYRGATTKRRIGFIGQKRHTNVRVTPSPLTLKPVDSSATGTKYCGTMTVEVTPPSKSTRKVGDSPFLDIDSRRSRTGGGLAANITCTPTSTKGEHRCCERTHNPDTIGRTELSVRYLGGRTIVQLNTR